MTNCAHRFELETISVTDVRGSPVSTAGFSGESVRGSLADILESSILCSMATVTPEGAPHINTANFSWTDALDVIFMSHPSALHCRNLLGNPSMAMTVFSTDQPWTGPGRGVQLFGAAGVTSGADAEEAARSYSARFAQYDGWKTGLAEDDPAQGFRFYRFRVARVKILDEVALGDAWVSVAITRS
ncbi:pyridoxamine 5'-phosphate oxidase family protein [Sphingosinicella sp. LHD-64]|uniref:pyridoxamine 5'-phosphate oxidase family protein n=1 Tax=Sphingosinicella sp. LHD-64 TaxID=3072139 RepID=UPI00280E28EF|nr:pyridoxamine 5'-phosphate oxidase family protein [Sphingosinicella sp. LHD-64]MDQ8754913.1 pyridoxamine 5'-phosphate oxidase family protein [Sphingosinicella sp. LHD-64]